MAVIMEPLVGIVELGALCNPKVGDIFYAGGIGHEPEYICLFGSESCQGYFYDSFFAW